MPPKKEEKKIDGVEIGAFNREQMEEFAYKLKESYDREREERNFFQTEKDKYRSLWEISKTNLNEARVVLKNRSRQIGETQLKNSEKLLFFKQKVKYFDYEFEQNLKDSKERAELIENQIEEEYNDIERLLISHKREKKSHLVSLESNNLREINEAKIKNKEELSKELRQFEARVIDFEHDNATKLEGLEKHLVYKYEMEISALEERKNEHISGLINQHEKAFDKMTDYFNDITQNNLTIIMTLKEEIESFKEKNQKLVKKISALQAEAQRLRGPLEKKRAEIREYKRQLINYNRDKATLNRTKLLHMKKVRSYGRLRMDYEQMESRFEIAEDKKEELYSKVVNNVGELEIRMNNKNHILRKRIHTLNQLAERREMIIKELKENILEPPLRSSEELKKIIEKKNSTINSLQFELAKVCKAHDDLLETCKEKLAVLGVKGIDFAPIRIVPQGQGSLSFGPAGLVTTNR